MTTKDNHREGPTYKKFTQLLKLFHPKYTRTLARIDKFSDLNIQKLNELTGLNIMGLIIDVDQCIAPNHGEILKENLKHIKKLYEQNISMVVYSNMIYSDRYDSIKPYATILTNVPAKPEIKGYVRALEILKLNPEEVAMVGDNYVTDSGSLRLGIPFIKVKPIKSEYTKPYDKLLMPPYSLLRKFYSGISRFHDLFRKKPLTSKDLNS